MEGPEELLELSEVAVLELLHHHFFWVSRLFGVLELPNQKATISRSASIKNLHHCFLRISRLQQGLGFQVERLARTVRV